MNSKNIKIKNQKLKNKINIKISENKKILLIIKIISNFKKKIINNL
jgi:hypothetical protein